LVNAKSCGYHRFPLPVVVVVIAIAVIPSAVFAFTAPLSKSAVSVAYAQYAVCTSSPRPRQTVNSQAGKLIHFATLAAPLSGKSRSSNVCRINKNIICCDLAQRKCKHSSANAAGEG